MFTNNMFGSNQIIKHEPLKNKNGNDKRMF